MRIIPIEAGPVATIGYLVIDMGSRMSVIIDAPLESTPVFMTHIEENKLKLSAILLSHSHWDHTADAAQLHRLTQAPVYLHKDDEYRLIDQMSHTIMHLPFNLESHKPQGYFSDGDVLEYGGIKFEVRHTPGHTEGGVCFIDHLNKVVFAGDTLFNSSIGRVDLPGGSMATLLNSIKSKIFSLPDDYMIYPGHGPSSTVGREKNLNPFFN
ncbi:MAG: MBL fold metallo-hydrolase [Candidatus Kapaibacterium sp.]